MTSIPEDIVRIYQKRSTMENYIKETKHGFGLDNMLSYSFQVNQVQMMLSLLAYKFTNWLRTLCFPKDRQAMQINTVRTYIKKVASIHQQPVLSANFVYVSFFWQILKQVQTLQIE